LPTVFEKNKRPWVQPDNDSADNVTVTVQACPSGALHYTRKDGGEAEAIGEQNTIRLTRNGPLYIHGDITIVNSAGEEILNDTRVTLCRCGASANKPFCDNSHIAIGFQAPATIEDPQTLVETTEGGTLTIETTLNGPLHITGIFTILDRGGKAIAPGTDESFCRCGASENKPFCDNSHSRIGFVAE
jgi:CDGSH-type Zn-finger protein